MSKQAKGPERGLETACALPTATELAHIAATLAHGRQGAAPEELAKQSLALWQACRGHIEFMRKAEERRRECAADMAEARAAVPKPRTFPCSLDDALRVFMPNKNKADRLHSFRLYLRERLREVQWRGKHGDSVMPEDWPLPDVSEVADRIAEFQRDGFEEAFRYDWEMDRFRHWLQRQPSERARHAAKARHGKRTLQHG